MEAFTTTFEPAGSHEREGGGGGTHEREEGVGWGKGDWEGPMRGRKPGLERGEGVG